MRQATSVLLCKGKGSPASTVCVERNCAAHPCVCGDDTCPCQKPHEAHRKFGVQGFKKSISNIPKMPSQVQHAKTVFGELMDSFIDSINQLRSSFNSHVEGLVGEDYKYGLLRDRLLKGEKSVETDRMTGDTMCRLLDELQSGSNTKQLTTFSVEMLDDIIQTARADFRKIMEEVNRRIGISLKKRHFEPVVEPPKLDTFKNQVLTVKAIKQLDESTELFERVTCISNEWALIGKELATLPLQTLSLRQCNSGDEFCKAISKCKSLLRVRMQNCKVTDAGAKSLVHANNLVELDLEGNQEITTEGFCYILKKLKRLAVFQLKLPTVKRLAIDDSKIEDHRVALVTSNLPDLEKLTIDNNGLRLKGALQIVRGLQKLSFLSINNNPFGDEGIEAVCSLPCLTKLFVAQTKLTEKGLLHLSRLKSLISLDVGHNNIGDAGVELLAKNLIGLVNLKVVSSKLSEQGASAISKHLTKLKSLDIQVNKIRDAGASYIAKGLPLLERLGIGDNQITKQGAIEIAKHLKHLYALAIDTNNLGEEGAIAIAEGLSNLQHLEIHDNAIGDKAAYLIIQKLPNLQQLTIGGLNGLTPECKTKISQKMKERRLQI